MLSKLWLTQFELMHEHIGGQNEMKSKYYMEMEQIFDGQ